MTGDSMDGMGDAIILDGVSKRLTGAHTVRVASLRVRRGTIQGLLGRAGAETTALLRMIAGLDRPDQGKIVVEGFDAWADRAVLRHRLAYMPQSFGAYPDLTVEAYLDFFEAGYGAATIQRPLLTAELLELVGLEDRRQVLVDDLDPDARQWLALARCLIHDPDVLLLDMPLQGMSSAACAEFTAMLREMQHLGKTVVITSSHALELEGICAQISHMRQGMTVDEGATDGMVGE